jgi:hypothetical protein
VLQQNNRRGEKGVDRDVNIDGSVYSKLALGEELWEKRAMLRHDEYSSLITKAGNIETNRRTWVLEKMPIIQPVLNELDASL